MFHVIDDLLSPQHIQRLREIAVTGSFQAGNVSNPANQTKKNEQIEINSPGFNESSQLIGGALWNREEFQELVIPLLMAPPLMAKYRPGMTYGAHMDAAILNISQRALRSDVSCTVFINEPDDYDGGELVANFGTSKVEVKGKAGSAVIYPSMTLHEVKPVTAGERLVAITFIQSRVQDPLHREILFNLGEVAALEGNKISWENRNRLEFARQNLLRMWGET